MAQLAAATNPDGAVIDLALKSASGIDLIKRLKAKHENLLMIVWSIYSEDLYAERALGAGARGYINKGKLPERHVGAAGKDPSQSAIDALSDRELDVFRLIGQGVKTAEIAAPLHLSVKTVETYRDRIREKLDLSDGAALARSAAQGVLENG